MKEIKRIKCDNCKNHADCKHIRRYYDEELEWNAMHDTLETLYRIKDSIINWSEKCSDYEYNDISKVGL